MTSTRETSAQDEEEGAEEKEGREEGVAGSTGVAFVGFTHGCFAASCIALCQINSLLMAPMT